jgi:hypothetical protein
VKATCRSCRVEHTSNARKSCKNVHSPDGTRDSGLGLPAVARSAKVGARIGGAVRGGTQGSGQETDHEILREGSAGPCRSSFSYQRLPEITLTGTTTSRDGRPLGKVTVTL